MISEATSDLQEHLQLIDERMQTLLAKGESQTQHTSEVEEITEEKEGIRQCLGICTQMSNLIEEFQSSQKPVLYASDHSSVSNSDRLSAAKSVTNDLLTDFKTKLSMNSEDLVSRLRELEKRLKDSPQQSEESHSQDTAVLKAMEEERDSISQCSKICADASDLTTSIRTNVYEDVSSADNSHQLVVSTIGDLISARHVITGSHSIQWLGQMSDDTLQKLSNDNRRSIQEQHTQRVQPTTSEFDHRYDTGRQLEHRDLIERQTSSNANSDRR